MTDDQWRRTQPVLSAAIGVEASEWDRLLESALGRELELRGEAQKSLEQWKTATFRFGQTHPVAGTTESRGPGQLQGSRTATAAYAAGRRVLEPADMCGRFRIVRLLGVGGMGQVYLAEDVDLGTPVALKLVSDHLFDSPNARARLRREAVKAAQLRYHPHIATVLQFMQLEVKGREGAVLVMEYVAGVTASALVADRPIATDRALRWTIQVARAIEFAHEKGILHCDLKPANIQITRSGAEEHVKVLDFGIARAVFDPDPMQVVAGTPFYMAPEQLIVADFGEAGDIYSLGVTLFELITGRRPYQGADLRQLLLQIIAAPIPKASAIAPQVPRGLDAVLERAMAKEPERRFESMAAFRQELEKLLPSPTRKKWFELAAAISACVVTITLLGFVASQALDQGLGRTADFGARRLLSWFEWGARSLFAPIVFSATLLLVFLCLASAFRIASSIKASRERLEPLVAPVRSSLRALSSLPTPLLSQSLLLVHVVILGALAVYFRSLLAGFMNFMTRSPGSITELRHTNLFKQELYGYLVTSELLVFCAAWYQVLRLRASRREHDGLAYAVGGLMAVGLSLFLFTARFRVLYHNEAERVVYQSQTCYVVERRERTTLVFCPLTYPRNLVARAGSLIETDKIENIFSPLDPP